GERLFDLDDHLGIPGLSRARHDLRTGADVLLVLETAADAGVGLDRDFVTASDEGSHAGGLKTDPIFVILDFLGDTDAHDSRLLEKVIEEGHSRAGHANHFHSANGPRAPRPPRKASHTEAAIGVSFAADLARAAGIRASGCEAAGS